jgi:hypothetical protein
LPFVEKSGAAKATKKGTLVVEGRICLKMAQSRLGGVASMYLAYFRGSVSLNALSTLINWIWLLCFLVETTQEIR